MTHVYYSLLLTIGEPLKRAQTQAQGLWTTPSRLNQLITFLDSLDFSEYDTRRLALAKIRALNIPQFFLTYPFDPLSVPIPPVTQVRFPGAGTYVYIGAAEYQAQFIALTSALRYRDSDGPIDPPLQVYVDALLSLQALVEIGDHFFDQLTWELSIPVIWDEYPPIPPVQT